MFSPATQSWFDANFTAPTDVQRRGWETIARGAHALLVAPTGSGKTLAVFLHAIDRLTQLREDAEPGVRVLYISPLKALVYDVDRNLRVPLMGVQRSAQRLGLNLHLPRVDVRTGDTPQKVRNQQSKDPAEILVTTPESLFLLLGSKARDNFQTVHTVIVDEVHALAPNKRGAHLALSLERLVELTEVEPQRIGLSATVRPLDEVGRFLGGDRDVEIVDASAPPRLDLQVVVPVPDMERVRVQPEPKRGGSILGELYAREVGTPPVQRGIWPAMYPKLLDAIRINRSTIIFVNSRGLCERLAQHLNELADQPLVRAHHGSVSHEKRAEIEEALKAGRLRGIVATSSLELGIDMGAVDTVILVESPGSVARGLQRVGRAGHHVGAVSVGRIYPKFRGDLLECAVVAARMRSGELEALHMPRSPLDVLAQQIVALCADAPRRVDEIATLVRRAYPYRQLSDAVVTSVLDMLSGHYPSSEFADLRPLLAWDRSTDVLSARRGAAIVSRLNAGTIPDRGNYGVFLGAGGPRVGELDEEMVFETKPGDHIMLGASTWRIEEITRDQVLVTPAPGEPGRLPFWRGDGPGRPLELCRALGALVRELGAMKDGRALAWLQTHSPVDEFAARNLLAYIREQKEHTGTLPTDRSITVERFRDELGDWRICILSPFGARLHGPWAMAIQQQLAADSGFEVQVMYTDDGIVLRFADADELPSLDRLLPDPDELEELVTEQLGRSALFAGLFRENAARALLLPRQRPGKRSPLWAQRLKAQSLLATVQRYPSFPIVLETYRQALSDVFDVAGLTQLLRDIQARRVHVVETETRSASPFARSLVFAYVAAYLYEQDSPLAERKAQALTLDRGLLAELLGQAELRELLDADVIAEVAQELQHLSDGRRARDADELHDLLRRLGDLDEAEIAHRVTAPAQEWLQELQRQRRAVQVTIAAHKRWIAAEDAGLYRDALGAAPPSGLPDVFLQPVAQPLQQLLRRYARSHGPFVTADPAIRYGLREAQLEPVLRLLENEGVLLRGEIRPGGAQLDWCEADVLRQLKRRTLARLRREVAPVDGAVLGCFLPQWQGLYSARSGNERLLEVVAQLQGLPLPWSSLIETILPARVAGFQSDMLDLLSASGAVVWVGCGPLGARDGRVALYLRERAPLLLSPQEYNAPTPIHVTLLQHLAERGASFLTELQDRVRQDHPNEDRAAFEAALWDLVWAGQITNDTFAPLRSLGRKSTRGRRNATPGLAGGRWSLVAPLLNAHAGATERAVARANMLLERHGVVSREAVQAEELTGGFGSVYGVLKAMEEQGKVRRGYFIEGLAAAQFAYAGAVERLRGARPDGDKQSVDETDLTLLAAVDPANPYGTLLPWPETGAADDKQRPRRVSGAWVALVQGKPVLYIGPRARQLLTFPDQVMAGRGDWELAFSAMAKLPSAARRGYMMVEKIDGLPVSQSPHFHRMLQCGFQRDYRGLAVGPN